MPRPRGRSRRGDMFEILKKVGVARLQSVRETVGDGHEARSLRALPGHANATWIFLRRAQRSHW